MDGIIISRAQLGALVGIRQACPMFLLQQGKDATLEIKGSDDRRWTVSRDGKAHAHQPRPAEART